MNREGIIIKAGFHYSTLLHHAQCKTWDLDSNFRKNKNTLSYEGIFANSEKFRIFEESRTRNEILQSNLQNMASRSVSLFCCQTWTRTKIHCSRGSSPTIRRSGNCEGFRPHALLPYSISGFFSTRPLYDCNPDCRLLPTAASVTAPLPLAYI